ncbi:MAG: hypothetical protein EOP49_46690, partial [Sphingobacteriales bacterium]
MKIISIRSHGLLDYLFASTLIALPFVESWEPSGLPAQVIVIIGLLTIAYSLVTKYELGPVKVIPFSRVALVR